VVNVRNREEVAQGLDSLGSAHVDAVNALASPILNNGRGFIVERLNQMRLPAIHEWPETAEEGGFLATEPAYSSRFNKSSDSSPRSCMVSGPKTSRSSSQRNSISS
jgi:hypothetical protein